MHELQEKYKSEINELALTSNKLAAKGYVTSHGGNLSLRVSDNIALITPTKTPKESVQSNDVVIVDFNGKILYAAEGRKPTGEAPMHINMLKKRPDITGIIHSHPPVLTGFAIADSALLAKPVLPEVVIEVGPVLSVDYAEPLSDELAAMFDQVLDYSNAFLMKNHGIMVCAREGVARALEFTDMLEAMAVSLVTAQSLGAINFLTREDVENLENVLKTRNMPLPGNPKKATSLVNLYCL